MPASPPASSAAGEASSAAGGQAPGCLPVSRTILADPSTVCKQMQVGVAGVHGWIRRQGRWQQPRQRNSAMRRGQAGRPGFRLHQSTPPPAPPAAARCRVASRHARLQNNNHAGHAGSATAGLERGAKDMTDAFLLHSPPPPQPTPSPARPPTQPHPPHPCSPPSAIASIIMKTYAGPLPLSPVTALSSFSSTLLQQHAQKARQARQAHQQRWVDGWPPPDAAVRCSQQQACQTAPPAQHLPNQPAGRQAGRHSAASPNL